MTRKELLRGAAGSFVLNAASKALMLLASVLLARLLGAEGFGAYSAAVALAVLLAVLASLGLPTLLVRLVSSHGALGEWRLMRGALAASAWVVLGASLVITLLAQLFVPPGSAALAWALVLVPLLALNALRSAALRGLHRVLLAQVPECLVLPGVFLALVAWQSSVTPGTAALLRLVATLCALAVGAWFLRRHLPLRVGVARPEYQARAWAGAAGPLFLISALSVVNLQAGVLLLALLRGPESAGVFQAAARGAELVAFSLLVANFALQPMISRLYAVGDMAGLQRVVTLTSRIALAVALPTALVFIFLGAPILGALFGEGFERGAFCLAILCAAQAFSAAMGSVDHLLNMTGHERDAAGGLALGALANVVLGLLLIPVLDIEGAALAAAASVLVWTLALSWRVRRRLGISSHAAAA